MGCLFIRTWEEKFYHVLHWSCQTRVMKSVSHESIKINLLQCLKSFRCRRKSDHSCLPVEAEIKISFIYFRHILGNIFKSWGNGG